MSLDGAILSQLAYEIVVKAENAKVERVAQPSRDEIILHLRGRDSSNKLLINVAANNARLHFTDFPPENPKKPPIFCMLLRKYLQSSKLIKIEQQGLDRIIFLLFEGYDELGDKTVFTLVVEIMGKYSNIILLNDKKNIIDALRKIDFNLSSIRQILPGIPYIVPPEQNKLNIITNDTDNIIARIKTTPEQLLSKALMNSLQGFSPLPAREISYMVNCDEDQYVEQLDTKDWARLKEVLEYTRDILKNYHGTPTMVIEQDGRPKDFSFMPINQYESYRETKIFKTYSQMLDSFYIKRDTVLRISQRSGSLLKLLENTSQRITRRVAVQLEELEECKNRDELKLKGDLLMANVYQLEKGQHKALINNYYDNNKLIEIDLSIRKTPVQNAQQYYVKYKKASTAEKKLTGLIEEGKREQEYIDSVLDSLKRSETEADLETIKSELISTGYLKQIAKKKQIKLPKQAPHTFKSSDGFTILAGRNNMQNDRLTLKDSSVNDIWLHTQKIPGSHVIIVADNQEVPTSTLLEAGEIAAYHSKARYGVNVPVDYTKVRYVKKISGAKPGMVNYDNFKTIIVDPKEINIVEMKK